MTTAPAPLRGHTDLAAAPRFASIGPPAMRVPELVVPNKEVAGRLGVKDGWIESRTGVHERRRATGDEQLATLAAAAGREALELARLTPHDLDLILVATITADDLIPNAAPVVAAELGAPQAGACDIGAACTGFITAIALGAGAIESGRAEHVLVIGADFLSRYADYDDKRTAGLWGDAAGAVTLSGGSSQARIAPVVLHTDPAGPALVYARRGEAKLRMEGPETFRYAVDLVSEVSREAARRAGVELDDIDLFVFHQANGRILSAVGARLELDPERVVDCIAGFGNTSAASIPVALCRAREDGRLRPDATVLFGAIGAGFTYGAFVTRWGAG
jgi:3-oxoacyl-[acyl-carrier-protein] synthase III